MKVKIWTMGYFPFTMGGSVHQPISCEVHAIDLFDIGKGQKAYLVLSPKGKLYVAESETGAIVGHDVEEVRKDISSTTEEVLKGQLEEARKLASKAKELSIEEFWSMFRS